MFCIECGQAIPPDAQFCFRCGNKVPTEISEKELQKSPISEVTNPVIPQSVYEQTSVQQKVSERFGPWSWFRMFLLLGIGVPALTTVLGLPSIAEFVLFRFNTTTLLNGGWLTWFSGDAALIAKTASEDGKYLFMIDSLNLEPSKNTLYYGMTAGYARTLLWCVFGFISGVASRDVFKVIRLIRREISA